MQRAFTLIELMAVVAIMALLGAASVGGYSAMQRGMRERSAVASASALLRAAKERAAVDRVPTAVYCYNVMLRERNADADENAVIVGVMTAVRRAGRVTKVAKPLLYDEFGDLNKTYQSLSDDENLSFDGLTHKVDDLQKRNAMKLYRFPTSANDQFSVNSGEMEYSLVSDAVWCATDNMVMLFSGTATGAGMTNCMTSAFYMKNGSNYEPQGGWKIGDAYAFAIGEIQLPLNMTFGEGKPASVSKISKPKVFVFDPQENGDASIDVNTLIMGAGGNPTYKKAGKATSDESKGM